MPASLSPPRVLLLAVHFATNSNIQGLTALVAHHPNVLRPELLLRLLLTCLPETLHSSEYVGLIERIESGDLYSEPDLSIQFDSSSVQDITDAEAAKKVRRLHLLPLTWDHAPRDANQDPVSLFLIRRAHRLDQEAGLLTQVPDLIVPFLQHAPCIRIWMVSALLPLLRRNYEYYPNEPVTQTLESFERLDNKTAVALLLSQTGVREEDLPHVGRDLRGLIGPWLHSNARWEPLEENDSAQGSRAGRVSCPAWEYVLEWLTMQASISWKVAVKAFDQWDGPSDVDLGGYGSEWLDDNELGLLEQRYARAALASAYLIPEASLEALSAVNSILTKIMSLLDQDPCPTLQVASSLLPPFVEPEGEGLFSARSALLMRNDLLEESNYLTAPDGKATQILHILTLSAFILTKAGTSCSVRRAGELVFLQDEREQQAEAMKVIRSFGAHGPKNDDKYWIRARNELLWLRDWGAEEAFGSPDVPIHGVFGRLKKEFLEVECLKAFLANTRYSLARSIYEDSPERPLGDDILQDTVVAAALEAYDNALNPHRGRGGGLSKCSDIIQALPKTLPEAHPAFKRIEALLRATHGLSEYRLVLKKGEPFTPVVLRVHADPVSIIGKVLEQNPKTYTNIQDLLEIGSNMVDAGLLNGDKPGQLKTDPNPSSHQHVTTRKRITAMCVDAALAEDDFETAYSYVVNRVASDADIQIADDYSWKAALQAGKYRRTARTMKPTHIGTASGNLDIRHLEQRMECLSTAVRVAPPATLQEIINVFRKCEEELNAAVKAEEAQESAWDARGDLQAMPGAFSSTVPAGVVRNATRSSRHAEEAPMSLFDLSRASMSRAQRNFLALSSLQRSGESRSNDAGAARGEAAGEPRVRKRDQLREAAVGTLASGVGWLIGAQPLDRGQDRE